MANRARQGIGRITGRRAVERQQSLHHRLHLAFIGPAEADHSLLDAERSVFVNHEALRDGSANSSATRLPQQQRRLRIDVDENLFDRSHMRLRIADHVGKRPQNRAESLMQISRGNTDHTGRHVGKLRSRGFDDAITGSI